MEGGGGDNYIIISSVQINVKQNCRESRDGSAKSTGTRIGRVDN